MEKKQHLVEAGDLRWRMREDIFLEKICEEYVLIASWSAWKSCPAIRIINETGAFFWDMMASGNDFEEIYREMCGRYSLENYPKEEVFRDYRLFLEQLASLHYLEPV